MITPATYYKWSKDFMEAGKHRLQGDTLREANTSEVKIFFIVFYLITVHFFL